MRRMTQPFRDDSAARQQAGFTAIELLLASLILAVLAAVAIPAFMKNAKKVHQDAATDQVHALSHAQQVHYGGHGTFGSAPTLRDEGLIPPDLAAGRTRGYNFVLNVSADGQHYDVTACPAAINRSGNACLQSNENDVVIPICPPGQQLDAATGECVPQDTLVADAGLSIIHSVDVMSGGTALAGLKAIAAAVPTLAQQVATVMDLDHDGLLSADEMLNPDILGASLRPLLAPFTDAVRVELALGLAGGDVPGVPIATLGGDLLAYLNRVPSSGPPSSARK